MTSASGFISVNIYAKMSAVAASLGAVNLGLKGARETATDDLRKQVLKVKKG